MTINPNDYVRVRLTDRGRSLILAGVDEFNHEMKLRNIALRVSPPTEDADGWAREQFWSLMRALGDCWSGCGDLPFTELEKE